MGLEAIKRVAAELLTLLLIMTLVEGCGASPTPTQVPVATATVAQPAGTVPPAPTLAPTVQPGPPTATLSPAPPTVTTAPPIATTQPVAAATAVPPPGAAGSATDLTGTPAVSPDHVIITGQPGDIPDVLKKVEEFYAASPSQPGMPKKVTFVREEAISLPKANADGLTCAALAPCFTQGAVSELYQMYGDGPAPSPLTIPDHALKITAKIRSVAADMPACVSADPVYPTGVPAADPWIAEGSPWIAEGSPAGGVGAAANADAGTFMRQWAFSAAAGIGLTDPNSAARAKGVNQGQGVRVGVFDTSPALAAVTTIVWTGPTHMPLHVYTPTIPISLTSFAQSQPVPKLISNGISDHGLFVAGLIHGVVPLSDLYLYKVLDDYGRGDLWRLNKGLLSFITQTLQAGSDVNGAVLNLSLGIRSDSAASLGMADDISSTNTLLAIAYCRGMVVVAAAGNDSALTATKKAEMPAASHRSSRLPPAILTGRSACYSNQGEVTAPGGEAVVPAACDPGNGFDAANSLLGPMKTIRYPTGFAYWAGTSFATPLVSGLAALILEREAGSDNKSWIVRGWQLSGGVPGAIAVGSSQPNNTDGTRVINVPTAIGTKLQ